MEKNLISIIMPVYNGAQFLHSCIESVKAQQYQQWELIAVDDGSSDGSVEIIRACQLQDKRIRLLQTGHEGVSSARMAGLLHSAGEYIAFLDCDDLMSKTMLSELFKKRAWGGNLCPAF